MSANFKAVGNSIQYANIGTAKTSGSVVIVGHLVGIAETDIAATTGVGTVAVEGVYEVVCDSADVITVGMKLDWDASASKFVDAIGSAASGDNENGVVAVTAAPGGVTAVNVKLCPGVGSTT
jgi:predicted RecA/RadA family phage recombinase